MCAVVPEDMHGWPDTYTYIWSYMSYVIFVCLKHVYLHIPTSNLYIHINNYAHTHMSLHKHARVASSCPAKVIWKSGLPCIKRRYPLDPRLRLHPWPGFGQIMLQAATRSTPQRLPQVFAVRCLMGSSGLFVVRSSSGCCGMIPGPSWTYNGSQTMCMHVHASIA